MSDMYFYENNQENNQQEHGYRPEIYPTPRPKKNHKNFKKFVRKTGALALSAVLFGGIAAGTFQGVNRLADSPTEVAQVETEQTKNNQNVTKTSAVSSGNVGSMDVSDIVKTAMPSIVAITNKSVQEVESFFGMFGRGGYAQEEEVESCGSGIIIGENDTELLILTNNHVVEGADTLSVCFNDDQACEAVIKGTDAGKDLAVIAVPLDSIPEETFSAISIAAIGDSDALEVGEQVVAIGNALGYGQSVTTGIVSATNRTLEDEAAGEMDYDGIGLIQTDAAINPGNSGGALLNMDGEVIGVNSAKLASTEIEGIGYAISINDAYETIQNLMNMKTRTKAAEGKQASIGISGTDVSEEAQESYGIPAGVFIAEITEGGAAEAAGIVNNSVITAFDGKTVSTINELVEMLEYYETGETVDVTLQVPTNNGYTEQIVSVTLGNAITSTEETQTPYKEEYNPSPFDSFYDFQDGAV